MKTGSWSIRPPRKRDIRYCDEKKQFFLQYCSTVNHGKTIDVQTHYSRSRAELEYRVFLLQENYEKAVQSKGVYCGL